MVVITTAFLVHAKWDGWTLIDMVAPAFLFCIGVAMPLSFARRAAKGDSRQTLLRHVLWRAFVLVALGFVLNLYPTFDFENVRIPSVLSRIGLCYGIAGVFVVLTARMDTPGVLYAAREAHHLGVGDHSGLVLGAAVLRPGARLRLGSLRSGRQLARVYRSRRDRHAALLPALQDRRPGGVRSGRNPVDLARLLQRAARRAGWHSFYASPGASRPAITAIIAGRRY